MNILGVIAGVLTIAGVGIDAFEAMLAAYQRGKKLPSLEKLHTLIRGLLVVEAPAPVAEVPQPPEAVPATFAWTEYEQLMISEAVHRGETVYNVALRIDPDSLMRAAAFQLIRNVLHGCGTLIALRPEDNLAAATVEVVEAAVASAQSEDAIKKRCRIPSIVSDVRVERATSAGKSAIPSAAMNRATLLLASNSASGRHTTGGADIAGNLPVCREPVACAA